MPYSDHTQCCRKKIALVWLPAIFLGSGRGFGSLITRAKHASIKTVVLRVDGWLLGCLFFCVDVIDDAQQCNVLQVIKR